MIYLPLHKVIAEHLSFPDLGPHLEDDKQVVDQVRGLIQLCNDGIAGLNQSCHDAFTYREESKISVKLSRLVPERLLEWNFR